MVTRILLDPRRDLTDGTTQSNPVIVTATPTGISEAGQVVVLPTSLSFTIATSVDLLQLPASAASWKWRLAVRDSVTNVLLQQRTVLIPNVASIAWQDLPDVDPTSLGDTVGHARNWDATFAQMLTLIQQVVNVGLDDVNAWAANTAYPAGTTLLNPSEQFVQAPADVPARSTYAAGDWTILTLNLAGVQALIAAQAATDAATYATLEQLGASVAVVDNNDGTLALIPLAQTTITDRADGTLALTA